MIEVQDTGQEEDELLREKTMLILSMELQEMLDDYRRNGVYSTEAIDSLALRVEHAALMWPRYWWVFTKMRAIIFSYRKKVALDLPLTQRVLLWVSVFGGIATALHFIAAFLCK